MRKGRVCALVLCLAVASTPVSLVAREAQDLETFRVFLLDGRMFNSHGECATLPDELVCVVRLGGEGKAESHNVVTVPLWRVDEERTTAYARQLRAARYGATRGERAFTEFTARLSQALTELEAQPDRSAQLSRAQALREQVARWSDEHFGYRTEETRQLTALLEGVVAELRVATGQRTFSLDISATVSPAVAPPLLAAPSRDEELVAALEAASVTTVAAERLSLLRSVARAAEADPVVSGGVRARAARELSTEERLEARYAALRQDSILRADDAVVRGRPEDVLAIIRDVRAADRALGYRRPREVEAFVQRLEVERRLAEAQRAVNLEWRQVRSQLLAYERGLRPIFDRWERHRHVFDGLRAGQRPSPSAVDAARRGLAWVESALAGLKPVGDLHAVHAVLQSATQMAQFTLTLATRLTVASNPDVARQASSAAAGAALLLEQGRRDLVPALYPRSVR